MFSKLKFNLFTQYRGFKRENYVLFFGRIVTGLGSMVWPLLTLILTNKLGYSATTASLLMIIAGFVMMPANMMGGMLADRFSKKKVIVVCDMISVVLYVTCAFIPLGIPSLVLILIAAASQNMEHPAYNGIIADITPTKDRERAYSLQYLGTNLGLVAAPTIAGVLFHNHLWLVFLLSGLSIFSSTILIWIMVHDITPIRETADIAAYQQGHEKDSLLRVLKENGATVLFLLVMTIYSGAYMQYSYLMPMDLMARHGDIGSVIYGSLTSVNCVICVFFTPVLTRLFSKRTHITETLVAFFMLMGAYLLFLLPLNWIPVYYVAMALFTLGEILTTIAKSPHLNERVPAAHRGRVDALSNVMTNIAYSICIFISGRLYDMGGHSTPAWIFVLGFASIGLVLCICLFPLDQKRYPKLYTK